MEAHHAKGSSLYAVVGVSQEDIKPGSEALNRSLVLYMCVYTHTHTRQSIVVFVSCTTGIVTCR